jgi:hypothetical protein
MYCTWPGTSAVRNLLNPGQIKEVVARSLNIILVVHMCFSGLDWPMADGSMIIDEVRNQEQPYIMNISN